MQKLLLSIFLLAVMFLAKAQTTIPTTNDYPYPHNPTSCPSTADAWGFYQNQCVSWVAWKVNQTHGYTTPSSTDPIHNTINGTASTLSSYPPNGCNAPKIGYVLGNACHWDVALAGIYTIDNTPAVGAIAQWHANEGIAGNAGHVAFVNAINANGTLELTDYNYFSNSAPCTYYLHSNFPASSVGRFIHTEVGMVSSCSTPSNNSCSSPTSLSINTSCSNTSGDVCGALVTSSGLAVPSCSGSTATTALDVWYTITSSTSQNVIITCTPQTTMDAVVAVYTGSCSSTNASSFSLVNCVDANSAGGQESLTFSVTSGTAYFIRVYDYNANSAGTTFQICATASCTLPATPSFMLAPSIICENGTSTWTCASSGATSYTWTLPSGWSGSSSTYSITPTAGNSGGTISVAGNNACGSSLANLWTVSIKPLPNITTLNASLNAVCSGTGTTLYTSGSCSGCSYSWSPSITGSGSSGIAYPTTPTTYTVTASNGCLPNATNSIFIGILALPATPILSATPTVVCAGNPSTLSITNYDGVSNYSWSNSLGSSQNVTVNPITTTTYTVSVYNSCGYSSSNGSITVSATSAAIAPTIQTSGTTTFCSGGNVVLSNANACLGCTYQWNNSVGQISGATNSTYTATIADTYSLTATDACGNVLNSTNTITVAVNTPVTGSISGLPSSICSNSAAIALTGSPSGGTFTGSGVSGSSFNPASASIGANTITYNFTSNGCSGSATQSVTVNALPNATFNTLPSTICQSASAITLTPTTSGGTFTDNGNTLATNQFNPSTATLGSHTITYSITVSGCTKTSSQSITVTTPPTVTVSATNTTICSGTSTTLNASGASSYSWSPSSSLSASTGGSVTATPTITTTYIVTGNPGGCQDTASIIIVVKLPVVGTITASNNGYTPFVIPNSWCAYDNAQIKLIGTPTGGTFTVNGIVDSMYNPATHVGSNLISYTYTSNGCNSTISQSNIGIVLPSKPKITHSGNSLNVCQGDSITLTSSYPTGTSLYNGNIWWFAPNNVYIYHFYSFSQSIKVDSAGFFRAEYVSPSTGCVSDTFVIITVLAPTTHSIITSICSGQSYTVGTSSFNTTGTFTIHLTNYLGCDSTVILHLTVKQNSTKTITTSICSNKSYTIGTSTFNTSGTHVVHLTNYEGCDSLITLHLTVKQTTTGSFSITKCGGSYLFNGINHTNSGTFKDTLTNYHGCDSVVTLHLTINPTKSSSYNHTICSNQPYTFNNHSLTASGTYLDTFQTYKGCDSLVTLHLTVNPAKSSSYNHTICSNQPYTFNNHSLTASGTYLDTFQTYKGCDSLVTLHLTVNPTKATSYSHTTCNNQPYTFNNHSLTTSGTYLDTFQTYKGCDSLVTLHLTVNPAKSSSYNHTICSNQPYTFNNHSLTASGTYLDTFQTYKGCDSLVTLHLTVNPAKSSSYNHTICSNQPYTFNNHSLTASGTYLDTFQTYKGCDSLVTLHLTVNPAKSSSYNHTICSNQPYTFNNHSLTTSGTYLDTFQTYKGCDSLVTLHLTVNPLKTKSISQSICSGDSFQFNGHFIKTNGSYYDTLSSATTCDTIVTLHLTVNPYKTKSISQSICANQSYSFNGHNLIVGGNYFDTLPSTTTCDTIVTLHLTVNLLPVVHLGNDTILCNNASITLNAGSGFTNYLWNNNSTNQTLVVHNANTYFVKVTDNNGCKGSDTIIVKYTVCTGVNEVTVNDMLKVYPNPTSDILIVEFMNDVKEATKFELYNAAGQLMQANTFDVGTNKQIKLSLQNYATGNYILKIKNSKMDYSMQVNKTQ